MNFLNLENVQGRETILLTCKKRYKEWNEPRFGDRVVGED